MRRIGLMIATSLLALLLLAGIASAANEQLIWSAIGAGGGTSTNGAFSLQANIGSAFGSAAGTDLCSGALCEPGQSSDDEPTATATATTTTTPGDPTPTATTTTTPGDPTPTTTPGDPAPGPDPDRYYLYLPLIER
jgi:hypothetical protein